MEEKFCIFATYRLIQVSAHRVMDNFKGYGSSSVIEN